MTREIQLPVLLQNTELAEYQKRLASPAGDRIRCRGNRFLLPDGTEATEIETVILTFVLANTYYDRPFRSDEIQVPACYALGTHAATLAPSSSVIAPQATTCVSCPKNKFGSGPNGVGKACRNTRRVAVLSNLEDPENCDLWIVSVPPKSIKPFENYIRELLFKYKVPPYAVVTNISLDARETFASFQFHLLRPVEADVEMLSRRAKEAEERLLTDNFSASKEE
jgi:hypothetical protein